MIEQPLDEAITAVTTTSPKARARHFMGGVPERRSQRRRHIARGRSSAFPGGIGRAAHAS
jgi:hypothetical protein